MTLWSAESWLAQCPRHDCEKQQLLICFHALTESNWGSDWILTLQTEWGEASGQKLNEDIKADLMG